jgi:cellulose synthase/poly-beta-1,6-N-acetylglucosamine synthase-like glycosyltransferase
LYEIMTVLAISLLAGSTALLVYAYLGYPCLLALITLFRRARAPIPPPSRWPLISITIPVYNEAATIAATLRRTIEIDYPPERRQILVVSDASTDGTDEIVRGFASQGVELLRLPARRGKTAAENAALPLLRGEIIVNTDASIHIPPESLRPLIAAFEDSSVGVASGRDVSTAHPGASSNQGESGYVGYEMWVRELETRVAGIVGASGCFYAIRAQLHQTLLPDDLSRDFAAALIARESGYRAVSVPDATCFVPRTMSLRSEFHRKVRTMSRGMRTLLYKRQLLHPFRYGLFAWMLASHKVCRWLVPWAVLLGVAALSVLSFPLLSARWVLPALGATVLAALTGWAWLARRQRGTPGLLAFPAYLVSGNLAAIVASIRTLRGRRQPFWEPTRRTGA